MDVTYVGVPFLEPRVIGVLDREEWIVGDEGNYAGGVLVDVF